MMTTDTTATVIAAWVRGPDPARTISELVAATRLPRRAVEAVVADLASQERLARSIVQTKSAIIVRWTLLR